MNVFKKTLATFGIAALFAGIGAPAYASNSSDAKDVYNRLSVAKNGAGQSTPSNNSTLRKVAQNRANALAKEGSCKAPGNSNPFPSKPTGYLGGSQLQGTASTGDYTLVTSNWVSGSKGVVLNSGFNHLGTGVAKDKAGCVYVVANFAKVQAPAKVAPKPAPKPAPKKTVESKKPTAPKPAPKKTVEPKPAPKPAPKKTVESKKPTAPKPTPKPAVTSKATKNASKAPVKPVKPSKAAKPTQASPSPPKTPVAAPDTSKEELLSYKERVAKAEADRKNAISKREAAEARNKAIKAGAKEWTGWISTGGFSLGGAVIIGAAFIRRKPLETPPTE